MSTTGGDTRPVVCCDLDGVVWRGETAIEGSAEGITRLRAAGLRVVFLTNNSNGRVQDNVDRLAAVGVEAPPDDVASSAQAAAALLAGHASAGAVGSGGASTGAVGSGGASAGAVRAVDAPEDAVGSSDASADAVGSGGASTGAVGSGGASAGAVGFSDASAGAVGSGGASAGAVGSGGASAGAPRVLACAGPGVVEALVGNGFEVVDVVEERLAAVVVGWHREFDFERLRRAADGVRAGARFIATNLDPTYPGAQGLLPGAGSLVAAVATAGGRQPEVAGKPEPAMAALVRARYTPSVVMIGDRPSTDGAFARQLGVPFALVLSGIVGMAGEEAIPDPAPAFVAADLAELAPMLVKVFAPAPR